MVSRVSAEESEVASTPPSNMDDPSHEAAETPVTRYHTIELAELAEAVHHIPSTSRSATSAALDAQMPRNFEPQGRLLAEAYKGNSMWHAHVFSCERVPSTRCHRRYANVSNAGSTCVVRTPSDDVGAKEDDASAFRPSTHLLELAATGMSGS